MQGSSLLIAQCALKSTALEAREQYEREFILSKLKEQLEHLADSTTAGPGAQLPLPQDESLRHREVTAAAYDSKLVQNNKVTPEELKIGDNVFNKVTRRDFWN